MITSSDRHMRECKAFGKWSFFRLFDRFELDGFSLVSVAPVLVKECFSRVDNSRRIAFFIHSNYLSADLPPKQRPEPCGPVRHSVDSVKESLPILQST